MPRIPGVRDTAANWLTRALFRFARKRYGAVPEPMAVSAHHPALLLAGGLHELAVDRAARSLPANVRELAVYRAAVRLGCSWCVDFGTMLQRLAGLDVDRLASIHDYATSPRYSDEERLAIAYADAMTDTPVSVTDAQVAELVRAFGRKGTIELTYLIGLDITDQGFTSGDACRVPFTASDDPGDRARRG